MNQKVLDLINQKVLITRKYIESFEPSLVDLNDGTKTVKDVWNDYATLINKDAEFQKIKSDLDYIIYVLTESRNGLTTNISVQQKILQQLNKQIETLKCLRKALEGIDNTFYYALRYYEKGGGTI